MLLSTARRTSGRRRYGVTPGISTEREFESYMRHHELSTLRRNAVGAKSRAGKGLYNDMPHYCLLTTGDIFIHFYLNLYYQIRNDLH